MQKSYQNVLAVQNAAIPVIWNAAIYAGVIIGTKTQKPENTGFCRFNPIVRTLDFINNDL